VPDHKLDYRIHHHPEFGQAGRGEVCDGEVHETGRRLVQVVGEAGRGGPIRAKVPRPPAFEERVGHPRHPLLGEHTGPRLGSLQSLRQLSHRHLRGRRSGGGGGLLNRHRHGFEGKRVRLGFCC